MTFEMTSTNKLRKGQVVIISNEEFIQPADPNENPMPNLPGYATDVSNLRECFQEHLGFDYESINIVKNQRAQEILETVNSTVPDMLMSMWKKRGPAFIDYFVTIILTHGGKDGILFGNDGKMFHLRDFMEPILTCRALAEKPKIFIVQACKGPGMETRQQQKSDEDAQASLIFGAKDALVVYSTTEGYLSWVDNDRRDRDAGSCFIWHLCQKIKNQIMSTDLVELFTSVNYEMAHQYAFPGVEMPNGQNEYKEVKQMSCFESTLRKQYELVVGVREYSHTTCRGRAIIINNAMFPSTESVPSSLNGSTPSASLVNHGITKKDVDALTTCFTDTFSFSKEDVIAHPDNQTSQQMKDIIEAENDRLEKMDGRVPDCFVCVILTHRMTSEYLYGSDGKTVHLSDLIKQIQACSKLQSKPKIFLMQAYATVKPEEDGRGMKGGHFKSDDGCQKNFYLPSQADKLVVVGCSQEQDDCDRATNGSKFIQKFCEVCNEKKGQHEDFVKILTLLNEEQGSQWVSILSSLTKRLIL